jgi:hypothetical protein
MAKGKILYTWIRSHKVVVFVLLLLVIVAIAGIVSVVRAPGKNDMPSSNSTIVKTGKVVCLPHKNSDGPQTMECAIGLYGEDQRYYALKDEDSQPGQSPLDDVTNKRVEITGKFAETKDSNYNIAGTITIRKLKVIGE